MGAVSYTHLDVYKRQQDLCREIGEPSEISKVYLKINGKNNLENAKKMLSGI